MKTMTKMMLVATVALSALTVGSAADATTVTFSLLDGATTVANGSFQYATGTTGILNYSNLTAFNYNIGSHSYNLAYVLGNASSQFQYLGYSTSLNTFVPTTNLGYTYFLTSIASDYLTGFYTDVSSTYFYPEVPAAAYTSIQITSSATGAVPETATWAMMIAGFGMMGAAMRTRRRSTKVSFA